MADWSRFVSMELDDEDKIDLAIGPGIEAQPDYPYGLRICLTSRELDKLGLEDDCEIGDMLDLRCFARVTSISKTDGPAGPGCRIELQITDIAAENEMDEGPGDDDDD